MWLEKIYLKLIVKFILPFDQLHTCVITVSTSPTRETAFCTLLFISSAQMSTYDRQILDIENTNVTVLDSI